MNCGCVIVGVYFTVMGAWIVRVLGSSEKISFALLHNALAWDSVRRSPFQSLSLSFDRSLSLDCAFVLVLVGGVDAI